MGPSTWRWRSQRRPGRVPGRRQGRAPRRGESARGRASKKYLKVAAGGLPAHPPASRKASGRRLAFGHPLAARYGPGVPPSRLHRLPAAAAEPPLQGGLCRPSACPPPGRGPGSDLPQGGSRPKGRLLVVRPEWAAACLVRNLPSLVPRLGRFLPARPPPPGVIAARLNGASGGEARAATCGVPRGCGRARGPAAARDGSTNAASGGTSCEEPPQRRRYSSGP